MKKFAALILLAISSFGDTIELKTGERIEGTFRQAGPFGVVIAVGGKSLTFEINTVKAIYLGAAGSPTVPALTKKEPPASAEAIDALRMLRSVTTSGINYRDYSTRVLDAKVAVDRYKDSATSEPARDLILAAMKYYEMGSQAWGLRINAGRGNGSGYQQMVEIGGMMQVDSCPEFAAIIASANNFTPDRKRVVPDQERKAFLGSLAGGNVAIFWRCGASKVAEAEAASKAN